jgi:hypothetical protein
MKLFVGLLLFQRHHNEYLLKQWIDGLHASEVGVHSATGYIGTEWRDKLVPTQPTSWAQTMLAHYALYDAFLKSDCDRFILLSESCFPIEEPEVVFEELEKQGDAALLMQYITHPHLNGSKLWFKPTHNWRKVHPHAHNVLEFHEQWYSLPRDLVHQMCQPDVRAWTQKCFARSGGDNEMFVATTLKFLQQSHRVKEYPLTYCKWEHSVSHPNVHYVVDNQFVKSLREQGFLFARKIVQTSVVSADLSFVKMARKKKEQKLAEGVNLVPVILTNDPTKQTVLDLVESLGEDTLVANWAHGGNIPHEGHFTAHANAAIDLAIAKGATHVWMLSDDVVIEYGQRAAVGSALSDPQIGMYTAAFNANYEFLHFGGTEGVRDVPFVEPTAFVISVAAWNEIGRLNEIFVRGWGVAEDYCLRLRAAGYRTVVDDRSKMHHHHKQTVMHEPDYEARGMEEFRRMKELHGAAWPVKLHENYPGTTSWFLQHYHKHGTI